MTTDEARRLMNVSLTEVKNQINNHRNLVNNLRDAPAAEHAAILAKLAAIKKSWRKHLDAYKAASTVYIQGQVSKKSR